MTHASEFLDYSKLSSLVEAGLITRREHPKYPLFIYNYTARAQFDRAWTPETLACRGLILDEDGNVVARPFHKFFNLGEQDANLPIGEPFEAFEKLDGSLGIAYREPEWGTIQIATRGAFASEQALWASRWWADNCSDIDIPRGETWLFEIIYPSNRIVIDYKDRAELVLLAVIETSTGLDNAMPYEDEWPFARAQRYDVSTVDELAAHQPSDPSNFEGFVIRYYSTGQRVKVKLPEYLRLHRLLTECSSKSIWELLAAGQSLDEVVDRVPDEFHRWVKQQEATLRAGYNRILATCTKQCLELAVEGDRKATALRFTQCEHPSVLFKLLDGKDPSPLIWKLLRPEYEKPFVVQHETAL